jgi:transposase InsO family protein
MIYHANARTTTYQRKRIRQSKAPLRVLARELGVSPTTIMKWKRRGKQTDRKSRPKTVRKALPAEAAPVLQWLRQDFFIDLDTLWKALQATVFPQLSRSSVYRELVRLGLGNLKERSKPSRGKFQAEAPGFLHIDVFYLPRLGGVRSYLYIAIDRATRLMTLQIHARRQAQSAVVFLEHCRNFFPFRIRTILTDNGSEFTNRFYRRKTLDPHAFDSACSQAGIQHKLTQVCHPWTNGLAERTGKTIKDQTVHRLQFNTPAQMRSVLYGFRQYFNLDRPYKAIGFKTPYQLTQEWYKQQPQRFIKDPVCVSTTL